MGLPLSILVQQEHILLKVLLFAMYAKKEHILLKDQINAFLVELVPIQIKVLPLVPLVLQDIILYKELLCD